MSLVRLCQQSDIPEYSGMAALVEGRQLALFNLPGLGYVALDNWDPMGKAQVLARGIVGDIKGEPCVASPLYKHHYSLKDGRCLEQEDVKVKVWPLIAKDGQLWLEQ
ncbi:MULTISPECIES: nitrite reductase small subunit NirD [Zobellella]|uniref:Nitrite reductase (NAD(P)H) small subunit n=1 Tax=Zobellella endophytica TaxID=2116700 RepID=A0A2P7QTZ2_9GAMM|nr:nitrite reductase small subunit NirD [Zobellella endophytica]PSJ41425.1 nitrite reductase (NAD(P)H) small subunit [Zobellella endophytica]